MLLILFYLFAACSATTNITIGGLFSIFDANGDVDHDQLEHLGAFLLAIDEINADSSILPNHHLNYAIRSGVNAHGAANAALSVLTLPNLGGIISSFHNAEASTATKLAGSDHVMTVNSMTDDTMFGTASEYPYKAQVIPIEAYEGKVMQSILCQENEVRVAIFDSEDLFGLRYVQELIHDKYCHITPLVTRSLASWDDDFDEPIEAALASGASIFLIFLSNPDQAAGLLESGYDHHLFREGTQIFMMHHDFVEHIHDGYPVAEMLKGLLVVEFYPIYGLLYSPEGQHFVNLWNNTTPLSTDCTEVMDSTFTQFLKASDGSCAHLNYTDYAIGNSSLNDYTALTYDATYALAHGLHNYCNDIADCSGAIDGYDLELAIFANVSFQGATGLVDIFEGELDMERYAEGNREAGLHYIVYNFQEDAYNLDPHDAFVPVKVWSPEDGLTYCPTAMSCGSVIYNTHDNGPASAYPPYAFESFPEVVKIGGLFSVFNGDGSIDVQQAENLAAFLMAIEEINNKTDGIMDDILPNSQLVYAVSNDAYGDIETVAGAEYFLDAFFHSGVVGTVISVPSAHTEAANMVFTETHVFSVYSEANTTAYGNAEKHPLKAQTPPLESYGAQVIQKLLCDYFDVHKITIFHSSTDYGIRSAIELEETEYCELDILSMHSFLTGDHHFYHHLIDAAKTAGSRVFVLLMDTFDAGPLLEEGYEAGLFGEDTLVVLIHAEHILDYLTAGADVKAIMKGVVSIEYFPEYGELYTTQGREFKERFVNQKEISTPDECAFTLDSSMAHKMYQAPDVSSLCGELNFTEYRFENKTLAPYTSLAYDATYLLALGLHSAIENAGLSNITAEELREEVDLNVSFTGVSGAIDIYEGTAELGNYGRGNRQVGHYYHLQNFNEAEYDSNPNHSFATVGIWTTENGVTSCPAAVHCLSITYNTKHNNIPSDTKPDIHIRMLHEAAGILWTLGLLSFFMVVFGVQMVYINRDTRHIKSAQGSIMYFMLAGGLFGAVRVLAAAFDVSDTTCMVEMWGGHLCFAFIFGAIVSKNLRLSKIFKSGFVKKDVTTKHAVEVLVKGLVCFVIFMIVLTVVGEPKAVQLVETHENQTTYEHYCGMTIPHFQTVLFILESVFLGFALRLAYSLSDIPDKYNESAQSLDCEYNYCLYGCFCVCLLVSSFVLSVCYALHLSVSL